MKRFGSFRPLDSVISTEDIRNLHLTVSTAAELDLHPNNTIAVFTADDGIYKSGDVVINKGDGNGWIKLVDSMSKVGPVTRLRGYKLDKRVYLKWRDPNDVYSNKGVLKCKWHHDIVVRKYGSTPQNEMDGTVVKIIYERNRYDSVGYRYLVDYVPDADGDSEWYYRVFTVTDNGTIDYSKTADAITVPEMPWSEIIYTIRSGNASNVFSVGDSWVLDDGNMVTIANISTTAPYRVTMMFRYSRYSMPFDTAKGNLVLTKDDRILSKKTYLDASGTRLSYISGTYITGTPLDGTVYEQLTSSSRRGESGNNRWSSSDVRYWLNLKPGSSGNISIRPCIYKYLERIHNRSEGSGASIKAFYLQNLTKEGSDISDIEPIPPYFYLKKYFPEILDVIVPTTCQTKLPICDGTSIETTIDDFFIPSITEVTGKLNRTYAEGSQFGIFKEDVIDGNFLSVEHDLDGLPSFQSVSAWTRSAYLYDQSIGTKLLPTNDDGSTIYANNSNGVIIAFNIG